MVIYNISYKKEIFKEFIRKHHYDFIYGFSKYEGNGRFTQMKYQNFIWFLISSISGSPGYPEQSRISSSLDCFGL